MQSHICVFGGSNPLRKDGYSIGRVHKKFGRTCKVCGSTPHRSIPLSRLPAACHRLPWNFLIPGKRAGAPVRLLPGCRGYRREKRGNSRWEERRRSPSQTDDHSSDNDSLLMDALAPPALPSGLLLNRHSAACRMKKGYGYKKLCLQRKVKNKEEC